MISLNVRSNIIEVTKNLRDEFRRQIPFAASLAINEMAFETREMLKDQMSVWYDGGAVTYTKNAIYSTKSNKRKLTAQVYVGGTNKHRIAYVLNTIDGGEIPKFKKTAFSPNKSKIKVTNIGKNMPRGFVGRNLVKPNTFIHHQTANSKMPSGLYRRVVKGKVSELQLLVSFSSTQVNKPTFPARKLSAAFVEKHFTSIMNRKLRFAIKTRKVV